MGCEPEELLLDGIPALRWGEPGGRAVIGVHGQFSNKHDPVMARCGDVIASWGDQLITFDLPAHGDRQDDKAFTPMDASPEVRAFARLARSQSTEVSLLANSIGAYFSLCDTPAGTFERAWMVSPLLDLEYYIRDIMAEYSVTDEQLEAQTVIDTPRGVLERSYLRFVEEHPARLNAPSWIIRGDQDEVVPLNALSRFVGAPGVELVQVEGGQHFLGQPPHLDTVVAWFEERYPA
ncbi:alpha/beta hydrolase [Actinomyces oris]|jgi:putative alpha/beta hydrolase|uniref:alpha/beta hydrolase n=1 Tax=Actinomyces oris TaxID=544580 RepID=UPI00242B32A8|nr:alpha/beta hydrolase [Actinomyces oris]